MTGKTGAPTGAELTELLLQAAELGVLPQNLKGHRFVFTGTLSMKRDDLKRLVRAAGGHADDRISYAHNGVLVHGNTGRHGVTAKMREATRFGWSTWTESELVAQIMPTS